MQQEIEGAHSQIAAPHSPPLLHPPPEPLPQPQPEKAKRNSHPQLNDDQRKLVEGFIRNYDGKPTAQWLARSAGISEVYAKSLLRRYQKNGTLTVKKGNRGRKSKVGMAHLEYLRNCMIDNCRLKDRELAELLREEYIMGDQALHSTTILKYGHNKMPEMGLGKWTVKMVSRRDPAANTEENKDRGIQVVKELNGGKMSE